MIELTGYESFHEAYAAEKRRLGPLNSNCLLPKRTIAEALLRGRVFLRHTESGLAVYAEEGDPAPFADLYYFLADGEALPDLSIDRPVLLEELDSNGRRAAYLDAMLPKLTAAGFSLIAENVLVEIGSAFGEEAAEGLAAAEAGYAERGYRVELDPTGDAREAAFALWRAHLKPTDLPPWHFAVDPEQGMHLVCLLDAHGEVAGVNWWMVKEQVCEIRHTVTRPDCLRQGIGSFLIRYALQNAAKTGIRSAYTFIDVNNLRSLAMYEKIGFVRTGKISRQYLLPARK